MKDIRAGIVGNRVVIERVSLLFVNAPSLINVFNRFLPLGYQMDSFENDGKRCVRATIPGDTVLTFVKHEHDSSRKSLKREIGRPI
jgi:paired amphipathic helix protein Sin3a